MAEAIEAELGRVPATADCGDLWHNLRRAVALESGGISGKRKVLVLHEPPAPAGSIEDVVNATARAQAFIQAVSFRPDTAVEEFCRRVGGLYREGDEGVVVETYLNLLTRYEVQYNPVNSEAEALKVRLHGRGLYAEMRLGLGRT
jgi:P2-related tail formation protein